MRTILKLFAIAAAALLANAPVSAAETEAPAAETFEFQAEVKAKRSRAMGIDPDHVEQLLKDRVQARTDRDWARADAIRDELTAAGVVVMDSAEGVTWRIQLEDASD